MSRNEFLNNIINEGMARRILAHVDERTPVRGKTSGTAHPEELSRFVDDLRLFYALAVGSQGLSARGLRTTIENSLRKTFSHIRSLENLLNDETFRSSSDHSSWPRFLCTQALRTNPNTPFSSARSLTAPSKHSIHSPGWLNASSTSSMNSTNLVPPNASSGPTVATIESVIYDKPYIRTFRRITMATSPARSSPNSQPSMSDSLVTPFLQPTAQKMPATGTVNLASVDDPCSSRARSLKNFASHD